MWRVLATVVVFVSVGFNCQGHVLKTIAENTHLNFTALGCRYGHPVEEYDVVTEDGYILKLFHIPGDCKRPVLLMHGFIDSADTFIIRTRRSLAITLADQGYDVWAGNFRGSKYSRHHVAMNPDLDKKFWDFSLHEIGFYDLPAIIDFVLSKTGQTKLSAIGHSMGNTIFYVLGSTKPEYNAKVNVMIAISPVCFLRFLKPPLQILFALAPLINSILTGLGQDELFKDKSVLKTCTELICGKKYVGYEICAHGVLFLVGGSDPAELEPDFFPVVVAHYPSSTSRKNALHLVQLANSRTFAQYDHGTVRNLEVYQFVRPAKYDLSKVKMPVAMLFGENDGISSLQDVALLRDSLPNVVAYRQVEHKKFNHMDAVWGRNMDTYLFPKILEILEKHSAPTLNNVN